MARRRTKAATLALCLALAACAGRVEPPAVGGIERAPGSATALAATTLAAEDDPALQAALAPATSRMGVPLAEGLTGPIPGRSHFVEFRSRDSYAVGHTYVVFGRLDEDGAIVERDGAGLAPSRGAALPFVVGHLIPVGSVTELTESELNDDEDVSARWRVLLTADEYERMTRHVAELRDEYRFWHAATANCNLFAGRVAAFMGYDSAFIWLPPSVFVTTMQMRNTDGQPSTDSYAGLSGSNLPAR